MSENKIVYMREDSNGNRSFITGQEYQTLLSSSLYQHTVKTKALRVVRMKSRAATNSPERNYALGGGRLRHPFS